MDALAGNQFNSLHGLVGEYLYDLIVYFALELPHCCASQNSAVSIIYGAWQ